MLSALEIEDIESESVAIHQGVASLSIPSISWNGSYPREKWSYKSQSFLRSVAKTCSEISPLKWSIFDCIITLAAISIAHRLTPHREAVVIHSYLYLAACISTICATNIAGIHERRIFTNPSNLISSLLISTTISTFGIALSSNIIFCLPVGRWILFYYGLMLFVGNLLPKFLIYLAVKNLSIRLLWIGERQGANDFDQKLKYHGSHYQLVGFWNTNNGKADSIGSDSMWALCRSQRVDQIILSEKLSDDQNILEYCYNAAQAGCTVLDECTFMEEAFEQVPVEHIKEDWFFQSRITVNGHFQAFSKRVVDIMVSLLVLMLGFPVYALIWVAVKMSGAESSIFTQERMGQFGKPFKMYKFRTMTVGSENKKAWTQNRDIRITRVGHFLRKTRLDELPQFWNVLKGDMSVVGPRPEIPELVDIIEKDVPYFSFRCWSRPGITGMAQIRYRYCSSVCDAREKLRYDLYYIKNWSIMMDIQIMLRTITALMKGSR